MALIKILKAFVIADKVGPTINVNQAFKERLTGMCETGSRHDLR